MPLTKLINLFGHQQTRPDLQLAQRLEKLLQDLEKPRVSHPSKYWYAKEIKKATAPLLLTIPFEKPGQFAIVWAQNRVPYGLMLFAQSKWPNIDHDLWAYTRAKHRGHNIAKLTLAEGIRQLAIKGNDAVLTAEILIENQRTRQGATRWLKVLGFVESSKQPTSTSKGLYLATYTTQILKKALHSLPPEFQQPVKKTPPMPPDILTAFTSHLQNSFNLGGNKLLSSRHTAY
jgi:hypothetical protein